MSFIETAYAQQHIATAQSFLDAINQAVIFPLITLLMAVALLVFLWGVFEYIKNASNDQAREQGRKHMIWGIIGMLVMLSAYSILTVAAGTFNLEGELDRVNSPATGGTASDANPFNTGGGGLTTGGGGGITTGGGGGITTGGGP